MRHLLAHPPASRDLRLQEVTQNHEHVRVWVPWARENGKLARTDEESNSSTENGVEMTLTAGAIASFQADGSVIVRAPRPCRGWGERSGTRRWRRQLTRPLSAARRRRTSCP